MNKNLTEIIFIIDESGSMYSLTDDTIGGFNGFVESQMTLPGEAYLTTVLFNVNHHTLHDGVDLREVRRMTREDYTPGGGTALLDAIGDTIGMVQDRHDNLPENERPDKVLCVITTDGMENSSRSFTKSQIKKMIDHQTKGHGWQFIFLGANMDAIQEASSIGIDYGITYTADSIGTKLMYDGLNAATVSLRRDGSIDENWADSINTYTNSRLSQ